MTGLNAQQTQLDVANAASDLQSTPSKIGDANRHEMVMERPQVRESK
jgi:hypothetical protein